jgi:hypothetical protein
MNADHDRLKAVLAEAAAQANPAERAVYLDGACRGDPEFRARVEALLRAHDRAGGFLEEPVVTAPPETLSVYAPFTYRLILTPRGDFVYVEHWDTEAVTGTMIGLDSGIVWTRTKNLSPYIVRSTGGGMEHYTFKGTFVSDHGPTIEVHEVYHVSYDANGELRVELFKFHARLK